MWRSWRDMKCLWSLTEMSRKKLEGYEVFVEPY